MNTPLSGAKYFLDGFSLITKPGLRRFVVIPLLINIIFFVALFFVARHFMGEFNIWFASWVPTWLHWLSTVLWLLFFISFFLVFVYTFVIVANIIAAPFNSFLAEKVELHLYGTLPEQRTLMENIKDVPRIVGRQLAILGFYLPRALGLLILFFIPVVHVIAPLLWLWFHAYLMALTYMDYPTDNHKIAIRDVRQWLRAHRWVTLGFGGCVLVASMIPIVNFFAIPAAVAGATKFWLEEV